MDEKLHITPARTLPAWCWVTVRVEYSADPRRDLPHITIPNGLPGVPTGRLVRTESLDGDVRRGPHGLPLRDVVPTARAEALGPALALTPGLVEVLEARLGAYPFETYGLLPCNSGDSSLRGGHHHENSATLQ